MNRSRSIFPLLLACLLAVLVGSPLCCCAGEAPVAKKAASSCCCCEGGQKDKKPLKKEACLCESKAPRDLPKAMLPPQSGPDYALLPAVQVTYLPVAEIRIGEELPRWQPCRPWHAPPAERRALLVSRTL